jgi:hypothetical protein
MEDMASTLFNQWQYQAVHAIFLAKTHPYSIKTYQQKKEWPDGGAKAKGARSSGQTNGGVFQMHRC